MNNDASFQPYDYQGQPAYQPQAAPYSAPQAPVSPGVPASAPVVSKTSGALLALTVLFALSTVIFIVLFVWMFAQYSDVSSTVDSRVEVEVAKAVDENTAKLQAQFAETEKNPLKKFAGPADYGEVTFNYPKTWSVYEYASATNGGEFAAVFNPDRVTSTNSNTINALRFRIDGTNYENAIKQYEGQVAAGTLQLQIVQINGANANLYIGELTDGFQGAIVIIKIRDKTVTFQTDSWTVFQNDFINVLTSINYNA